MGIIKQYNLFSYAFRNIQVYRGRTLSIIIFTGLVTGILSSMDFMREGINQDAEASLEFAPDILIQGYDSGRVVPVNTSIMQAISSVEGVSLVSPRAWGYLSAADRLYTLMGIDPVKYPLDSAGLDFELRGNFMTGEETDPVCILGSGVASAARADIGSYLLLTDIDNNEHEFEVIGIFTVASKIYTHDLIITSFNHSHAFFGLKDYQATDLAYCCINGYQ